jgi:hypothetical protein
MDKFVRCPPEALVWEKRRWRLLEEHTDVAIATCYHKIKTEINFFKFHKKKLGKARVSLLYTGPKYTSLSWDRWWSLKFLNKGFGAISGALSEGRIR